MLKPLREPKNKVIRYVIHHYYYMVNITSHRS
ncbi:MAG: hypothetical protein [Malazfec virus 1]